MPKAILTDEDFKKMFQEMGYNCNTIISKEINELGEVEIFWTYKEVEK
jgi:hypothetical protein